MFKIRVLLSHNQNLKEKKNRNKDNNLRKQRCLASREKKRQFEDNEGIRKGHVG